MDCRKIGYCSQQSDPYLTDNPLTRPIIPVKLPNRVNMIRLSGITLIELLIVIALSSIVLGLALPGFQDMVERNRATTAVNWLVGSITFTRNSALMQRTMVTLCPSTNGTSCGGDWQDGSIAFTDHNADRKINGSDLLLKRFSSPTKQGHIRWRSFGNRRYLQIKSSGMTNYQNGNFVYCAGDRDPRFSRQLVINIPGRPRVAHDRDDDGLIVDRYGKPLRC
jgi:type IV fimbrial biogenesis protein FimT